MKSVCKTLMLTLMLGITALMPAQLMGQGRPDPSIVISIANFDKQMSDVNYLLTASGFPEFKFLASAAIKGYTKGLDNTKSAGVMLYFSEESQAPDVLAFVPVSDEEAMLDVIDGMAPLEEDGDLYFVTAPDQTRIYIKAGSEYLFVSAKAEMLEDLPADPAAELGDLPNRFNLAARILPQRVPQALRDEALNMIEEGSRQTLDQLDEGIQSELQRKNLEMQMQQFEMFMNQTDELVIGWGVDGDGMKLFMDVDIIGTAGSDMAAKLASSKPDKATRFSGFLMDGAAFTMNSNSRMATDEAETYAGMMEDLKGTILEGLNEDGDFSDEEFEVIQKAIGDMFDVMKETMSQGVFDSGAVVMLTDNQINLAAGMQVASPGKMEQIVKDLIPMMKEKANGEMEVQLNSGSHKDVTFHEFRIQVPENEGDYARQMFGDQLTISLGIGKQDVYFGAGSAPTDLIKQAMDQSHDVEYLQQFNFYIKPILNTVASMGGPPQVEALAAKLEEVGKDRIRVYSNLIENGVRTRFEMQDGILSLIKVGVEAFQSGGFPEDDF